jgi:hypothetical protein
MGLTQFFLVTLGGFFNRVSDPILGATYVTLLYSFADLGTVV